MDDTDSIYGARATTEAGCEDLLYAAIQNLEDASRNVDMAVGGDFSRVTTVILGKVANNIRAAINTGNICQQIEKEFQDGRQRRTDSASESALSKRDDERPLILFPVPRVWRDSEQ